MNLSCSGTLIYFTITGPTRNDKSVKSQNKRQMHNRTKVDISWIIEGYNPVSSYSWGIVTGDKDYADNSCGDNKHHFWHRVKTVLSVTRILMW